MGTFGLKELSAFQTDARRTASDECDLIIELHCNYPMSEEIAFRTANPDRFAPLASSIALPKLEDVPSRRSAKSAKIAEHLPKK
jgi:hypothetical protein